MDAAWKAMIGGQFGASLDMLENALRACPDQLWSDRSRRPEFWYLVYHTLFFLDLYLSGSEEGFLPPAPFTLAELDPAGVLPERVYTKTELQSYLQHGRLKCQETIDAMTENQARQLRRFGWGEVSFQELLLYDMRHVQHHAAQLYLILRQTVGSAPRWVAGGRPSRPNGT
jgi:hypothetical protein